MIGAGYYTNSARVGSYKNGNATLDAMVESKSHSGYQDWLAALIAKSPQSGGALCSFCGKRKDEVKTMIHGLNGCICNECVVVCQEIIYILGSYTSTV